MPSTRKGGKMNGKEDAEMVDSNGKENTLKRARDASLEPTTAEPTAVTKSSTKKNRLDSTAETFEATGAGGLDQDAPVSASASMSRSSSGESHTSSRSTQSSSSNRSSKSTSSSSKKDKKDKRDKRDKKDRKEKDKKSKKSRDEKDRDVKEAKKVGEVRKRVEKLSHEGVATVEEDEAGEARGAGKGTGKEAEVDMEADTAMDKSAAASGSGTKRKALDRSESSFAVDAKGDVEAKRAKEDEPSAAALEGNAAEQTSTIATNPAQATDSAAASASAPAPTPAPSTAPIPAEAPAKPKKTQTTFASFSSSSSPFAKVGSSSSPFGAVGGSGSSALSGSGNNKSTNEASSSALPALASTPTPAASTPSIPAAPYEPARSGKGKEASSSNTLSASTTASAGTSTSAASKTGFGNTGGGFASFAASSPFSSAKPAAASSSNSFASSSFTKYASKPAPSTTASGLSAWDTPSASSPANADAAGADAKDDVLRGKGLEGADKDGDSAGRVQMAEQTKTTTGEEEEDTKYSLRSKLYSMEPDGGWKERGVGVLKVNVRKGDGKGARLVMRADGVLRLILNVSLYYGMNCLEDGKHVRMTVFEEGERRLITLRTGNPKSAADLASAIRKLIPGSDGDGVAPASAVGGDDGWGDSGSAA